LIKDIGFAEGPTNTGRGGALIVLLPLASIMLLFGLLVFGARQNSFTIDEPSHLTSGYAYLARGATWTIPQRGHPLLLDAWEAFPFFLGAPDVPVETLNGWDQDYLAYIEAFSPFMTEDLQRTAFVTRIPAILLALLLAAVVFRWGLDLGRQAVGLLALGTMIFDPTLLAHGRLATNDVGVTALGTLGLFVIYRWSRVPTWTKAAVAGGMLGLTMLAKGSGVLWFASGLAWAAWMGWRQRRFHPSMWKQVLLIGLLPALLLWGMYGFALGRVSGWSAVPVPAPEHWEGILFQAEHEDKPVVYALGEWRATGWLPFFPLAFLIKNPVPLLIGVLVGLAAALRSSWWRRLQVLGLFSALYLAVAIVLGPNLGYRHMMPIHPLLYLLIAGGIVWTWSRYRRIGRVAIVALILWYILGTMRIYPDNIAYFNEVVGGPTQGWRYLEGSNTDWGQAWEALRRFKEERSLTFSYSGTEGYARTAPYDLWDKPLPPLNYVSEPLFRPWLFPEPGDYVISANTLSGSFLVDPDNFAWFRYREPDAQIAHTLFYYHVDAAAAPTWLAQCADPVVPLGEDAVAEGFGRIDLRTVAFDCSQMWIYPRSGAARGVYALHGALLQPADLRQHLHLAPVRPVDSFVARHLDDMPQSFRQWENQSLPAFVLYEWPGGQSLVPTPSLSEARSASADVPPTALAGAPVQSAPVSMNGPLEFLGINTYREQETLEVETWWQVTEEQIVRPLSIMAHLLDADGSVLGVADGLGISPLDLTSGDVIVQRHRFPLPDDTEVWLRTGAYWLDSGERWAVEDSPGADAIFLPLAELD
jgi:hypothetical protein